MPYLVCGYYSTAESASFLGVLSGGLVFSWRERGCEGVRVVEVGRMELPGRCLTDPSLRCDWLCLQHWNGEP